MPRSGLVDWLAFVGLLAAVATFTVMACSPKCSVLLVWATIALAAALPFTLPTQPQWPRLLVSSFAVVFAARSWERASGRAPQATQSIVHFLVWWLVPAEARFPADTTEARRNRAGGLRRLARFVAKIAVVVVLVLINRATDDLTQNQWVFAAWSMGLIYSLVSAVADAVTGVVMLTGIHMSETFDAPLLARSPREFWGRRWNRFVHRWAFRNVFVPMGGFGASTKGTLVVFALSGLMHEYLVIACGGRLSPQTGHTLAFFLLQGVVVLLQGRGRPRLPRPVGVGLTLIFLLLTTPLFFRPLDGAVGYSKWWKGSNDAALSTHRSTSLAAAR